MLVTEAIERANALLPGTPAPEGQKDPRWQAISEVGSHVETSPDAVWQFARRWGSHPQGDLRTAIACCILEHLLEYHFLLIFPRVEQAVREDPLFADTFSGCWKFGQSEATTHSEQSDRLRAWCETRASK
jgi:hypothetical protein